MPYFFASLKVAVTQAFVGTVIAETVASNRGIGNLMMIASSSFDVPLVFAGLIILAALGVGALRHLLVHRGSRHGLGPPQRRIRNGLIVAPTTTEAAVLTKWLAARTLSVLTVAVRRRAGAGQDEDQVHSGLEVSRHPCLCVLGAEKGYFAAENLAVSIDQGQGSAATVTNIASGAYDAGLGDMNAIIQFAGNKPGVQPVMVFMMYNRPPFALITKANGPIKTLKDVVGRTMGSPAGRRGRAVVPLAG